MINGKLRRYTTTTSVLDLLLNKHLVLLNPGTWDDKNDSFYLLEYARRSAWKGILAACMTEENETYHHWKIFAGNNGACLVFKKLDFIQHVKSSGLLCGPVIYRTNLSMRERIIKDPIDNLPFLKRWAFRHEKEYRIIYRSPFSDSNVYEMPLPLHLIDRIVLSPWTPNSVATSFHKIVNLIPDCQSIRVHKSTLTDNETWKDALYLRGD